MTTEQTGSQPTKTFSATEYSAETKKTELAAWNAANVRARRDGQRPRNNCGPQTANQFPDETVPRETYMDQVRANAELAQMLRKTVAELEAAKRAIVTLQNASNNLR